jgi:hypothetical protein
VGDTARAIEIVGLRKGRILECIEEHDLPLDQLEKQELNIVLIDVGNGLRFGEEAGNDTLRILTKLKPALTMLGEHWQ